MTQQLSPRALFSVVLYFPCLSMNDVNHNIIYRSVINNFIDISVELLGNESQTKLLIAVRCRFTIERSQ